MAEPDCDCDSDPHLPVRATVLGCQPVGVVEIAHRLTVSRSAVEKWRERIETFPSPRWTVGGRPCWDWSDIEAWAKKTGRIK